MNSTTIAAGVVTVRSSVCGADIDGKACQRLPMHHGDHRLHLTERAERKALRAAAKPTTSKKAAPKKTRRVSKKPATAAQLAAREKFAATFGGRKAENLGPVVNPDGSPTDVTTAMLTGKPVVTRKAAKKTPSGSVSNRSMAVRRRSAKEALGEALAAGRITASEALALAAALA